MPAVASARLSAKLRATSYALLAALILSLAAGALVAPPVLSQSAKDKARAQKKDESKEARGEIILTNLPKRGSKAYNDLIGLAGKTAKGQILDLSESEMWSMPQSRIDEVIRQGESIGVKLTRLGTDWNQILKAPSAPVAMTGTQDAMVKAMEGSRETMSVGVMASPAAPVVEYALMKNAGPKIGGDDGQSALPTKIVIPLSANESITAVRTSVDMKKNGCTWRGEIEGTGEPVIIMWWKGGKFSGMFTSRGRMFTLKNMGGEVHAVVETDPGKMPPDHGAMGAPNTSASDDPLVSRGEGAVLRPMTGPTKRDRSNLKDLQDSVGNFVIPKIEPPVRTAKLVPLSPAKRRMLAAKKITIDVMVLYTKKAVAKYVDIETDLVALSIEQANESFVTSGMGNIKLRLVHHQEIDYDETGAEHFDHLYRMADGVDAFAKVRALRNEKRADIVALIVDDASGCGLSTRVAADADEAYVVAHQACAALTYSIAHEIGHIIGARHDKALDQSVAPFPYGHGYVNGTKWRDIMSYKQSCNGCPRLPYWSNPTIMIRGEPGGTLGADNARVILEQAERVSKFR